MILSQTKIFNIFASTIELGNILKNLTNNCNRDTINYISARDFWINLKKDSLFNKFLAKKVDQNENVLIFQIDSVINVTKNGETKIYKAVQKLKNLVKQNDGNQRNNDRPKISEQPKFVNREHFGAGTKN